MNVLLSIFGLFVFTLMCVIKLVQHGRELNVKRPRVCPITLGGMGVGIVGGGWGRGRGYSFIRPRVGIYLYEYSSCFSVKAFIQG